MKASKLRKQAYRNLYGGVAEPAKEGTVDVSRRTGSSMGKTDLTKIALLSAILAGPRRPL